MQKTPFQYLIVAAVLSICATSAYPANFATIVPGSLTQGSVQPTLEGGSYANESNNLGDWPLTTGNYYPISITNGNFNGSAWGGTPNTMIAFGNGGGVTLQFNEAIQPISGQKQLGIFTAQAYNDFNGSRFNGNMEAVILVSADGINWVNLAGDTITDPVSYTDTSHQLNAPTLAYQFQSTQQAWEYGLGTTADNLAALDIANFQTPMLDDSLFNGFATDAERLALKTDGSSETYDAIFGTSGGGNWFDLSGTGLSEVLFVRLNGVNVDGGVRLDAMFSSPGSVIPEPTTTLLLACGAVGMLMRRTRLTVKG